MPKLKGRASRRIVLDIGSSAIRLCELSPTKSGYQLSKYYQREMVIDPSFDDAAKREIRLNTLRELLREAKARAKKVVFGVPGQAVFTRTRALPPVPEHKVTQIVRYEIQQQIPFALDQIALGYQVLGRTEAGGYEVLMAAIKVDVVDKQLDLLQDAKRTVDIVDVAPLAAYNWLKHTGEFGDQGECVALLDIGAATTDIVIERDNQFRFTRSLNIGGNDITSAIARNFNVGFAEAEKLKRERGFAPTGDPQRDGKGGEVIGQVLGRLVSEIARSFAYFRSQPGGGPVSRVILTGGTASLRNIVPFLQRQLGLDVRIAQPLAGLAVSANAQEANERPEQASVALGLALRSVQNVPIEINLIPPRIIDLSRRKQQAFYWAASIVVLALIMASTVPLQAKKSDVVNRQIDALKMELAKFDPALSVNPKQTSSYETMAQQREGERDKLVKQIDTLDAARQKRRFWLDYIKVINDSRPPGQGVWFSSIQTTSIGGLNNTDDAPAAKPAAPAASGTAGGAAATGAAAGSAAADDEGDPAKAKKPKKGAMDEGGAFGGVSLGGGAFGGAAGAAGKGSNATSTGFPGIKPVIASGTGGGKQSGGSSMSMNAGGVGGMGAGASEADEKLKSEKPADPNGLTITGFAETPEAVADFVKRLKESGKFKENGVYLDESATSNVAMSILYNAPVNSLGGGGSGPSSARRSRDSGGGGGFSGRGAGGQTSYNPAAAAQQQGPVVTAFRVDVQFSGKPVELGESESLSGSGVSSAPMGGATRRSDKRNRND